MSRTGDWGRVSAAGPVLEGPRATVFPCAGPRSYCEWLSLEGFAPVENTIFCPATGPRTGALVGSASFRWFANFARRLSSDVLPSELLLEWELMDLNADGYIDADEQHACLNLRGSEVAVEEKKEKKEETGEPEGNRTEGEREAGRRMLVLLWGGEEIGRIPVLQWVGERDEVVGFDALLRG